jgi:hypothetical protein
MAHSHLTQWIEDAEAREFCQDAPRKVGQNALAAQLMSIFGLIFWAALIPAPIAAELMSTS